MESKAILGHTHAIVGVLILVTTIRMLHSITLFLKGTNTRESIKEINGDRILREKRFY